jgi:hypothetical protein
MRAMRSIESKIAFAYQLASVCGAELALVTAAVGQMDVTAARRVTA